MRRGRSPGTGDPLASLRQAAIVLGTFGFLALYYLLWSPSRKLPSFVDGTKVSLVKANVRGAAAAFLVNKAGGGGGGEGAGLGKVGSAGAGETGKLSRWQKYDWLPERDKSTVLNNYVEHADSLQYTDGERIEGCGNAAADEANRLGVGVVRRHVQMDHIKPVDNVKKALKHFEDALSLAPDCASARLNLAIILPVITVDWAKDTKRMLSLLAKDNFARATVPLRSKAVLWEGITRELMVTLVPGSDVEAHRLYLEAFELRPQLALLYFGKPGHVFIEKKKQVSLFQDRRMKSEDGQRIQTDTLLRLLLYYEYSKHFSSYNHVSKEQALGFHDHWHTLAKDMLPPFVVKTLQRCYRKLIANGILKFDDKQSRRYYHYNSPPAKFTAAVYTEFISRLWARPMKATYTYMGGYVQVLILNTHTHTHCRYPAGSELKPHVDRAQCEITMSVSIDVNPYEETCPLGLRLEPKKLVKERSIGNAKRPTDPSLQAYAYPRPGDALVFRGRGIVHWRDQIPEGMNCTNLFFHYVLMDFEGKID